MAGWFVLGFSLGFSAVVVAWVACGGPKLDPPSDWLGSEADAMAVYPPVHDAEAERHALDRRVLQLRTRIQRHHGRVLRFSRGGNEAA